MQFLISITVLNVKWYLNFIDKNTFNLDMIYLHLKVNAIKYKRLF